MKLNLDNQFVSLKGYPLPDKMSNALASALALSAKGRPEQMIAWAKSLVNDGVLEVNRNEIMILKVFVEGSHILNNLAKEQILKKFNKGLKDIGLEEVEE